MVPSLFLAHGSPMLAIEDTPYTEFLAGLGRRIRPSSVVIFTAHWERPVTTISASDTPYETIYDFGGFPDDLYRVVYPAKGSSDVAGRVRELLADSGISAELDERRGLDHGSWTLLRRMYPEADIPVVQVSVHPYLPPKEQYAIGAALRSLGANDVLVIGSGVTVHNLRMIRWGQTEPEPWSVAFDDWLAERIRSRKLDELFRYGELAPNAGLAVPRPEHFVPLFIAMGSGDPDSVPEVLFRAYEHGTLSYLCFSF